MKKLLLEFNLKYSQNAQLWKIFSNIPASRQLPAAAASSSCIQHRPRHSSRSSIQNILLICAAEKSRFFLKSRQLTRPLSSTTHNFTPPIILKFFKTASPYPYSPLPSLSYPHSSPLSSTLHYSPILFPSYSYTFSYKRPAPGYRCYF